MIGIGVKLLNPNKRNEGVALAGTNLVNTWLRVTKYKGLSLGEAIEVLLFATGYSKTSIFHGRIRQWERGEKEPRAAVVNGLMVEVLPVLLEQYKEGVISREVFLQAIEVPVKAE